MADAASANAYLESRIEEEPLLGPVLTLPDGSIHRLSWLERVLVTMRLADAKSLEARHFKPGR